MSAKRPKRTIIHKKLEYNEGMLWQEERALRKALYASLHPGRLKDDEDDDEDSEVQFRHNHVCQTNYDDAASCTSNNATRTVTSAPSTPTVWGHSLPPLGRPPFMGPPLMGAPFMGTPFMGTPFKGSQPLQAYSTSAPATPTTGSVSAPSTPTVAVKKPPPTSTSDDDIARTIERVILNGMNGLEVSEAAAAVLARRKAYLNKFKDTEKRKNGEKHRDKSREHKSKDKKHKDKDKRHKDKKKKHKKKHKEGKDRDKETGKCKKGNDKEKCKEKDPMCTEQKMDCNGMDTVLEKDFKVKESKKKEKCSKEASECKKRELGLNDKDIKCKIKDKESKKKRSRSKDADRSESDCKESGKCLSNKDKKCKEKETKCKVMESFESPYDFKDDDTPVDFKTNNSFLNDKDKKCREKAKDCKVKETKKRRRDSKEEDRPDVESKKSEKCLNVKDNKCKKEKDDKERESKKKDKERKIKDKDCKKVKKDKDCKEKDKVKRKQAKDRLPNGSKERKNLSEKQLSKAREKQLSKAREKAREKLKEKAREKLKAKLLTRKARITKEKMVKRIKKRTLKGRKCKLKGIERMVTRSRDTHLQVQPEVVQERKEKVMVQTLRSRLGEKKTTVNRRRESMAEILLKKRIGRSLQQPLLNAAIKTTSGTQRGSQTTSSTTLRTKKPCLKAQRKFAHSLPSSPSTTPLHAAFGDGTGGILLDYCPKTEDFLTFLCLRECCPSDSRSSSSTLIRRQEPSEDHPQANPLLTSVGSSQVSSTWPVSTEATVSQEQVTQQHGIFTVDEYSLKCLQESPSHKYSCNNSTAPVGKETATSTSWGQQMLLPQPPLLLTINEQPSNAVFTIHDQPSMSPQSNYNPWVDVSVSISPVRLTTATSSVTWSQELINPQPQLTISSNGQSCHPTIPNHDPNSQSPTALLRISTTNATAWHQVLLNPLPQSSTHESSTLEQTSPSRSNNGPVSTSRYSISYQTRQETPRDIPEAFSHVDATKSSHLKSGLETTRDVTQVDSNESGDDGDDSDSALLPNTEDFLYSLQSGHLKPNRRCSYHRLASCTDSPCLPPHLDLFGISDQVKSKGDASDFPSDMDDIRIPGVEPLPTDRPGSPASSMTTEEESASESCLCEQGAIRARAPYNARGTAKTCTSESHRRTPVTPPALTPPCLTPFPPPISAIPHSQDPPPLICMVPTRKDMGTPIKPVPQPKMRLKLPAQPKMRLKRPNSLHTRGPSNRQATSTPEDQKKKTPTSRQTNRKLTNGVKDEVNDKQVENLEEKKLRKARKRRERKIVNNAHNKANNVVIRKMRRKRNIVDYAEDKDSSGEHEKKMLRKRYIVDYAEDKDSSSEHDRKMMRKRNIVDYADDKDSSGEHERKIMRKRKIVDNAETSSSEHEKKMMRKRTIVDYAEDSCSDSFDIDGLDKRKVTKRRRVKKVNNSDEPPILTLEKPPQLTLETNLKNHKRDKAINKRDQAINILTKAMRTKRMKLQGFSHKSSIQLLHNSKLLLKGKMRENIKITVNSLSTESTVKNNFRKTNNHVMDDELNHVMDDELNHVIDTLELPQTRTSNPGDNHKITPNALQQDPISPVRRGRGRPPGSKNKPKSPDKLKNSKSTSMSDGSSPFNSVHGDRMAPSSSTTIQEVPVFHPTAEEWHDPMEYINSIGDQGETSGMCKIIPPKGWRPECKVDDDMRFSPQVQYIHRFHHRWGSNVQELACIKRHVAAQDSNINQSPQIGGCELDLVKFSQLVQQQGGLKMITSKQKWNKIADQLKVPKMIQNRVTKLDSIYCKYLLSYDTLSKEEKDKLLADVEAERKRNASKKSTKQVKSSSSECQSMKARTWSLVQYCRNSNYARLTHFKKEPSPAEVEKEYWKIVEDGESHVAVHKASLDTSVTGSGFPTCKSNVYAKHNWNLNNISNNTCNVLHVLPNRMGITSPELKLGMLYSTESWNCDRHSLPLIEYMHSGAPKVWYCIANSDVNRAEQVLQSKVPRLCPKQQRHLLMNQSFLCMISPKVLTDAGIPVRRMEQHCEEFVIMFPGAAASSISCGYNVAESIHCASPSWLATGVQSFKLSRLLRQPCKFSMDQLLCLLSTKVGSHSNRCMLQVMLTELKAIRARESRLRKELCEAGLKSSIRFGEPESPSICRERRGKMLAKSAEEKYCCICKFACYLSMVVNEKEDEVYCLEHGLEQAQKSKACRNLKLMYRYDETQLTQVVQDVEEAIASLPKLKRINNTKATKNSVIRKPLKDPTAVRNSTTPVIHKTHKDPSALRNSTPPVPRNCLVKGMSTSKLRASSPEILSQVTPPRTPPKLVPRNSPKGTPQELKSGNRSPRSLSPPGAAPKLVKETYQAVSGSRSPRSSSPGAAWASTAKPMKGVPQESPFSGSRSPRSSSPGAAWASTSKPTCGGRSPRSLSPAAVSVSKQSKGMHQESTICGNRSPRSLSPPAVSVSQSWKGMTHESSGSRSPRSSSPGSASKAGMALHRSPVSGSRSPRSLSPGAAASKAVKGMSQEPHNNGNRSPRSLSPASASKTMLRSTSPKGSPRGTPRCSPKGSPRVTPRGSPKGSPPHIPAYSPRPFMKTSVTSPKLAPRNSPKMSPIMTPDTPPATRSHVKMEPDEGLMV